MGLHISTHSGRGFGGKLVFSAFGIFFAVVGCFFVGMTWNGMLQAKAMQQWTETPCTIVASEMQDAGEDYKLVLSYSYTFNGRTYTADRYSNRDHYTAESVGEIDRMQNNLPPGTQTRCHVNPEKASEAVLKLPSVGGAFAGIAFTLIFPAFGMLFAVLPWLTRRNKENTRPGSEPGAKKRSGRWFPVLFGGIFVLVGLIALKPMFITPMQKTRAAKAWDAVPATVISSKVKSHDNDDSTTYSVYVAYRYHVHGQEYLGDRYTFMGGSSSGYEGKAAIVRQYPKGHAFTVFVNPENPEESVIKREAGAELLAGLIPLIFTLVGIGIILAAIAGKGSSRELDPAQAQQHVVQLKGKSPVTTAVFITLFSVFWNGVVYMIYRSQAGILFLSIFGLFGIIAIVMAIRQILALFNPRPTVEITPGEIRPGTGVALRWRFQGRVDRIASLTVILQCLKVTTETSGHGKNRNSRVVKTPLLELDLLHTDKAADIVQGTLQFNIPDDQPATRTGNTDGIRWQIVFRGDIPHWPDMKEELGFTVYYPAD